MTTIPSFTYAGGELAPGLWGRVDLNKYQTGLKVAKNFHVGVEGGLIKRPGMYFVGYPKFQDKETKLVRWRIADDDSYVLEFGHLYIRLYRLGGPVLYPGGHVPHPDSDAVNVAGFLEIPTVYLSPHVQDFKFTFANDVAYIFHKEYAPRKLTRLGLYDWSLEIISFNPHIAAPTGLAGVFEHSESGVWAPATGTNFESDYHTVPEEIKYKVSATMADGLETLPSAPVSVWADLGHHSYRVRLTWNAVAGADRYTIYKSKSGLFGFMGYVQAGEALEFMDTNFAPSYDVVPVDDWGGFHEDVGAPPPEYPRVGQFYKQRLVYAATARQPQSIWFSRPNHFHSMSRSIPAQEDDAIHINIVANERQTINHMLQLKKFIAFTDSGEWIIGPVGDAALSAATINPVQETNYGSKPRLEPIAIGSRILFVQNISNTIRDMGYEFVNDSYTADDLSRLARHLFENTEITAWAYSNFPYNVLWCLKADGTYCAMTYVREHEIWGWSRMETEGIILDVAVTPEIDQDATYFLTERIIDGVPTRFIERSEVLFTNRPEELFYVDCGISYKDERDVVNVIRLTDTTLRVGYVNHGLAIGTEIQLRTADFDYRLTITSVIDANNIEAETKYERVLPEVFTESVGTMFVCASVLTGFDHLAEQTGLIALADGFVISDVAIDATGTLTLSIPAAIVHCGFPYTARAETLNMDDNRVAGQFRYRAVNHVKLHLKDSRGVFAGASESERELEELESRSDEDYDQPPTLLHGVFEIQPHTEWGMSAGVIVEAPYPLPCHILNIVPDLSYGSD